MDKQRVAVQDAADRYLAATAAAGQSLLATRSGMGISEVGIEREELGTETSYRGFCTPRRLRGAASTLRFLVAGEAAQVALRLKSFEEVCLLSNHLNAAHVIRAWEGYWGLYTPRFSVGDDTTLDETEEEIKTLIWLARWQMCRRFHHEPERSTVEKLALKIRNGESLSGTEVERFIRARCRSERRQSHFVIPFSKSGF